MELTLYLAMLETLSDECLVEVFGRELRRRGNAGVMLSTSPGGVSLMASVHESDDTFRAMSSSAQLRWFARELDRGVQTYRGLAGDDVEGTVQPV